MKSEQEVFFLPKPFALADHFEFPSLDNETTWRDILPNPIRGRHKETIVVDGRLAGEYVNLRYRVAPRFNDVNPYRQVKRVEVLLPGNDLLGRLLTDPTHIFAQRGRYVTQFLDIIDTQHPSATHGNLGQLSVAESFDVSLMLLSESLRSVGLKQQVYGERDWATIKATSQQVRDFLTLVGNDPKGDPGCRGLEGQILISKILNGINLGDLWRVASAFGRGDQLR